MSDRKSWRTMAVRTAVLAAVFAGFAAYHLLNVRRDPLHDLSVPFDWLLPLIPAFSIPYLLYLPYLFFTVTYGVMLTAEWKRVAVSVLIAQAVASVFYVFYQTHVPRPAVPEHALFGVFLRFIYDHDQPYNTFPSLHATHSIICLYWWRRMDVRWFRTAIVLTVLILLSTVFLKQHVVADVLAGAALAIGALLAAERIFPREAKMKSLYDI